MRTSKKILVVDDTKSTQVFFQEELSKENYEVDSALSGEEAIKKIETKIYDLVFLDYNLSGMNGVETYKRIKMINPKTKIIMISGYLQDLLISGNDIMFIHKPFKRDEILGTAKKLVGTSN